MMLQRFIEGSEKRRPVQLVTAELAVGRLIGGRYALRRLIGRGGVGDVYLATQVARPGEEERDVVVKMLAGRWLGDSDAVARFEREAKRLRALEHPNIVSMYDSGVDDGRPYLVMEWIDGESLADYISRLGRLGLREFVPIAAQVLKGVGHAHSREMMIRDIKPSNIMLCQRKGRANFVKVLDFGLAKFMRNEVPLTEGYVLGTAGYLAPEAIAGAELDLRVDVYALGVLFYHMLAGAPPFAGCEDATIFYKTINEQPRELVDLLPENHGLPEGLLDLISDCLAKNPEDRPADANIVVERLIDVVPATFFRLPNAGGTNPHLAMTSREAGVGNTGLIHLLDSAAPKPPPANAKPAPETGAGLRAAAWIAAASVGCLALAIGWWASSTREAETSAALAERSQVAEVRPAAIAEAPAPAPAPVAAVVVPTPPIAAPAPSAPPPIPAPVLEVSDDDAVAPQRETTSRRAPASRRARGEPATSRAVAVSSLPPPPASAATPPGVADAPSREAPAPRPSVFLSADRGREAPPASPLLRAE